MASIDVRTRTPGSVRYQVRWRIDGGSARSRNFTDRAEAEAFVAAGIATERSDPRLGRRFGRTDPTPEMIRDLVRSRIVLRADGCWEWTGTRHHSEGYGFVTLGGRARLAHRVSYEAFAGAIPPGETIDHTCHNRSVDCPGGPTCRHRPCVNPAHLEPVSAAVNVRRSPTSTASLNAAKTHCAQGHPFDEANTYRMPKTGWRTCRACARAAHSARRAMSA